MKIQDIYNYTSLRGWENSNNEEYIQTIPKDKNIFSSSHLTKKSNEIKVSFKSQIQSIFTNTETNMNKAIIRKNTIHSFQKNKYCKSKH